MDSDDTMTDRSVDVEFDGKGDRDDARIVRGEISVVTDCNEAGRRENGTMLFGGTLAAALRSRSASV